MKTAILIPARLESTRFPNKMLADLNGKPLIRHVYDNCVATGYDTYVVTDSPVIASLLPHNIFTSSYHKNGTSRCCEAAHILEQSGFDYDCYVNVQGDMPDINKDLIDAVVDQINEGSHIATLTTKLPMYAHNSPDVVKVIRVDNEAKWFTRTYLPGAERHLGIYGFRKEFLLGAADFSDMEEFEAHRIEDLEQLQWLMARYHIGARKVDFDGVEINTPEDLQIWNDNNTIQSLVRSLDDD